MCFFDNGGDETFELEFGSKVSSSSTLYIILDFVLPIFLLLVFNSVESSKHGLRSINAYYSWELSIPAVTYSESTSSIWMIFSDYYVLTYCEPISVLL